MVRWTWAVIQPSAVHTVARLSSEFATAAAGQVKCRRYLALVLELELPPFTKSLTWMAFLVQPVDRIPLPEAYLPIWPCEEGSRAPLHPGFEWSFGNCVVRTSDPLTFTPVGHDAGTGPIYTLPESDAERLDKLFLDDRQDIHTQQHLIRKAQMREERNAAGYSSECGSIWRSWSASSTLVPIPPGQMFRPLVDISAHVSYNISMTPDTSRQGLEQDRKAIMRVFARFSWTSTERTIRWVLGMMSPAAPTLDSSADLTCPPLVEFAAQLDGSAGFDLENFARSDSDDFLDSPGPSEPESLAPPPDFEIESVRVIYFEVYGTLIDKESGVFQGLQPLLERSTHDFSRHEALCFYFESEMEAKRRAPGSCYAQILVEAYEDVALRLGMTLQDPKESLRFTDSIKHCPLMPLAQWCLHNLKRIPSISLVALANVEHDFLLQTPAFAFLAPFFEAVFTWDACKTYKPEYAAFDAPLQYFDTLGIPREQTCLVSTSLLCDMEPARELGVPALWMRFPGSLAGHMCSAEYASPVAAPEDFLRLVMDLLGATNTLMTSFDPSNPILTDVRPYRQIYL
ncbi:HAD-like domain-containing protein [Mycena filopes]|nr:HAD-like domain-containing protein [Mycena filopes]